jgi:DNA-directed RNA polymerase specialized sigma24 family protein
MKTSNDRKLPLSPSLRAVSALSDAQVQDEFDDLVMRASEGDSRAIASIAVALGPMLRKEARAVLREFAQDADDVLQDFFLFLLEGKSPFLPAHGRAVVWMCRTVRAIAQTRRERLRRGHG